METVWHQQICNHRGVSKMHWGQNVLFSISCSPFKWFFTTVACFPAFTFDMSHYGLTMWKKQRKISTRRFWSGLAMKVLDGQGSSEKHKVCTVCKYPIIIRKQSAGAQNNREIADTGILAECTFRHDMKRKHFTNEPIFQTQSCQYSFKKISDYKASTN